MLGRSHQNEPVAQHSQRVPELILGFVRLAIFLGATCCLTAAVATVHIKRGQLRACGAIDACVCAWLMLECVIISDVCGHSDHCSIMYSMRVPHKILFPVVLLVTATVSTDSLEQYIIFIENATVGTRDISTAMGKGDAVITVAQNARYFLAGTAVAYFFYGAIHLKRDEYFFGTVCSHLFPRWYEVAPPQPSFQTRAAVCILEIAPVITAAACVLASATAPSLWAAHVAAASALAGNSIISWDIMPRSLGYSDGIRVPHFAIVLLNWWFALHALAENHKRLECWQP